MKKQASVGITVTGKSFYWKKRRELCHNTCTCTCTCIYYNFNQNRHKNDNNNNNNNNN